VLRAGVVSLLLIGSALAMADVIGGHVDVMFISVPPAIPQVKAGKLRAPGATPRDIVNKLAAGVMKAAHSVDLKERYATLGLEPLASTPEQYAEQVRNAIVRWRKVIAAAKITPQ